MYLVQICLCSIAVTTNFLFPFWCRCCIAKNSAMNSFWVICQILWLAINVLWSVRASPGFSDQKRSFRYRRKLVENPLYSLFLSISLCTVLSHLKQFVFLSHKMIQTLWVMHYIILRIICEIQIQIEHSSSKWRKHDISSLVPNLDCTNKLDTI